MTNPEHPLAGSDFKLRILEDKENRDVHADQETKIALDRTLRKGHEATERETLDWNPQGKRRRGRPRHTWPRTVHNEVLAKGKSWSEVKEDGQKYDQMAVFC
jgi:hypothetical protein